METAGRTFDSWAEEWEKRDQNLYGELIRKINIFTGREDCDSFYKKEAMELRELEWFEDLIEETYNYDQKNCKPYSELSDNEKESYICNVLEKHSKNQITTYWYYLTLDGIPVVELIRRNKEKELVDKNKSLMQDCLYKIDIEKYNDLMTCARSEKEVKKYFFELIEEKEEKEGKKGVNKILKDEYKSDNIQYREEIVKKLTKYWDNCETIENHSKNQITTYWYHPTLDGIPAVELTRWNKEKELVDENESLMQNYLYKIDVEKYNDLMVCARQKLKDDVRKKFFELINENKVNNILKDEYKSNDIKYCKNIVKKLEKYWAIKEEMEKINKERCEAPHGTKEKKFKNIPDCVIKLFDWLIGKVNKGDKGRNDGSYSIDKLKKDRWEILTPEDQKYLLELLPQIKEYPDLDLSDEDVKNIEFKLTQPRLFRLEKFRECVEHDLDPNRNPNLNRILNSPQAKTEKYLSILNKLDEMYDLSNAVLKEIEEWDWKEEKEISCRFMNEMEAAIGHLKEQ